VWQTPIWSLSSNSYGWLSTNRTYSSHHKKQPFGDETKAKAPGRRLSVLTVFGPDVVDYGVLVKYVLRGDVARSKVGYKC
jgi:hypothetical protein